MAQIASTPKSSWQTGNKEKTRKRFSHTKNASYLTRRVETLGWVDFAVL